MSYTSFFSTPEQFHSFRTSFRRLANERALKSTDILIYNIIRGLPLTRGFSEVTNETKLAHGAQPMQAFKHAKQSLAWQASPRLLRYLDTRYGSGIFTEREADQLSAALK